MPESHTSHSPSHSNSTFTKTHKTHITREELLGVLLKCWHSESESWSSVCCAMFAGWCLCGVREERRDTGSRAPALMTTATPSLCDSREKWKSQKLQSNCILSMSVIKGMGLTTSLKDVQESCAHGRVPQVSLYIFPQSSISDTTP